MQAPSPLVVSTLGAFRLERAGQAAPKFKYLDARELLVYVLLFTTRDKAGNWRGRSKEEIGAALWGDLSDSQLNARFKACMNDLRRVLGAREWIVFEEHEYKFDFARGVVFDARDFLEHLAHAAHARRTKNLDIEREALQQAIKLYRGDFLQDYHTRRKQEFHDEREWYLTYRDDLQHKYRGALERLAQIELDAAQFDAATDMYRKLIALDEYDERAHAQLMLVLALQGKRSQALRHYQQLVETRADVPPDAELTALFEKIKRNETLALPTRNLSAEPPARVERQNNLPLQPTSFIGRDQELNEIHRLLFQTRLLTLTGAGGSGKTRLSLQAAAADGNQFERGVWFVELAPLAEASLVTNAVLNVLGLREEAGRAPLDMLTDFLRAKNLLLILDNCEHLIEACAQLAQHLMAHCPNLKILATSREALSVTGEVTYLVPPLAIPELRVQSTDNRAQTTDEASVARITEFDAVKLLLERAVVVQPNFSITDANANAIAQICVRLDGIPLAIELAAARIKLFSPQEIAARLDDRFRLLTSGSRTALPRQQTLRATLDWSYGLLSAKEKILFQRLAIFVGGWTFDAAEQVCTNEGAMNSSPLPGLDILELLAQLINKSLVTTELRGDETRYRMLETMREYGLEKLALNSGEGLRAANQLDVLRDKHLDYFVAFAEEAEPQLKRAQQEKWLALLDADVDNFRAALDWSKKQGRVEKGLRLATALARFWEMSSNRREGIRHLESFLLSPEGLEKTLTRANALCAVELLRAVHGEADWTSTNFEQAIEIARLYGDQGKRVLTLSLFMQSFLSSNDNPELQDAIASECFETAGELQDEWLLGILRNFRGWTFLRRQDVRAAREMFQMSDASLRSYGDTFLAEEVSAEVSNTYTREGDFARARQEIEPQLSRLRQSGQRWKLAARLNSLGEIARGENNYVLARTYYSEALDIARDLGGKNLWESVCVNLGFVALYDGELEFAKTLFEEGIAIVQTNTQPTSKEMYLMGFASLKALKREAFNAVRLLSAGNCLIRAIPHAEISRIDEAEFERYLAFARSQLSEHEFNAAWEEGRALTLEEALELARAT